MNTYNVTNTSDSGAGSLREAIALANTNLGTDNIVIDVDNVTLNTEIEITDSVSISGNGVVIAQTGAERLFNIDDNNKDTLIDVLFNDLTLTGGNSTTEGGAINSRENITLDGVTIKDNTAVGYGGGIYATKGNLTLNNSLFEGNIVREDANQSTEGSAIFTINLDQVTVNDTVVQGGTANIGATRIEANYLSISSNTSIDSQGNLELGIDNDLSIVTRDNPGKDREGASSTTYGGTITITSKLINNNLANNLELTRVTRFHQYEKGFHFYTADDNESSNIQERTANNELKYNYEGESFTALSSDLDSLTGEVIPGAEEVYRFFNNDTGAHLFTMDVNEKDYILDNLDNYTLEGVAYYAFEAPPENIETVPVYRMLNNQTGTHLLTSDRYEFESIQKNLPHFSVEAANGVAFYVMEI